MPISMRCPGCQTRFEFADDLEGKRIKCKSCGDIFRVAGSGPAKKARDDGEEERYGSRGRDRDDDYERQPSRSRRVLDDEDEDRPRRSRRDDDSEDDLPRRRDDDFDRPRKKKGPMLLLIIVPLALVGCLGLGVVGYFALRGDRKKGGGPGGDVVVAASRSCPLEVTEKEIGFLVLPDAGGNTFGVLRTSGQFGPKTWSFQPYDLAAKKALKRVDLVGVEDLKGWSISPDGKQLLLVEAKPPDFPGNQWVWLFPTDGSRQGIKWPAYQAQGARLGDGPTLYRAEIVANDKILTVGTDRSFYIYPMQDLNNPAGGRLAALEKEGLGKRSTAPSEYQYRTPWEVAFSADRKRMAVWTGDGYTIVNTADGTEGGGVAGVRNQARIEWGNTSGDPNRVKGGPAAFSPDGSTLAAVVAPEFGNKRLLLLWNLTDGQLTGLHRIAENQWNEAAGIAWWGNKFIATYGAKAVGESLGGILIDVKTGQARRQIMPPTHGKYGFTRDGKLWWAAGDERGKPAVLNVVDALDPAVLGDGDDYDKFADLRGEDFLRRLWLEPTGVLKEPTRDDPPIKQRLIRKP